MAIKSIRQAIGEALRSEMARDETVFVIGVDVAGGRGGTGELDAAGGVFGITKGLITEFGEDRVLDTPISETALLGGAVGAAVAGMRPVAELMFNDFLGVCFDPLLNQAAKFRYMFGGKAETPLVVRTMCGAGGTAAAQHSQSLYHMVTAVPGLKCVVPSNAYDAKGLLIQAIRDNDPVIFFEHKALYDLPGVEVPDEAYTIPFGEANFLREGDDVTIIALGLMAVIATGVADEMAKSGVRLEVVDPRTTSPLDEDSILESVEKTGRVVIMDESSARCGFAHDVAALIANKGFSHLKAPIKMVVPPHTPVPFSPSLESAWLPGAKDLVEEVMAVMEYAKS
ncbi:MAG: alpha-ketoacid dehydrogenase subunit beta [Parvibaculaceae bacterium]|nr:alpha-ketoacid dehydrogenase subunit beta [Parvibaculaceae bacterium]